MSYRLSCHRYHGDYQMFPWQPKLAEFQADCTPRKSKPEKRWWITVQFQYVTKASTAMSGPSESGIPRKRKRAGSRTQDTIQQKSPNMTFISAEKFRSSFATLKWLKLCLVLKLLEKQFIVFDWNNCSDQISEDLVTFHLILIKSGHLIIN